MAKRELEPGEHGDIETTPQRQTEDGLWRKATANRAQRWRSRCYVRPADGSKVKDISAFGKRKQDAERALQRKLDAHRATSDIRLAAHMAFSSAGELWLEEISRAGYGLAPRTVQDYGSTFRRYVDAEGSSLRGLTLTQANDVQRLRGFLRRVADDHGDGAAKMTRSVLAGILQYAVENGVLDGNAILLVKARSIKAQTAKETERDTARALSREERDTLLEYVYAQAQRLTDLRANPRSVRKAWAVADLVAVLAGTGCRINEARYLRWEHLNLKTGRCHIDGTKSASADRKVNLPQWLVERLGARAERSGTDGFLIASPALVDAPEVVWEQSNSSSALRAALTGAGYPDLTPHSLRKTTASLLHAQGVPLADIAAQLGHGDLSSTLRNYIAKDYGSDKSHLAALL
jgi:integrase